MSSEPERSDAQKIVMLEGDLTTSRAEEIKAVFINALMSAKEIIVTFGKITDVDLSCLQLLCAAQRSAVRVHKHVRFDDSLPQILKDTAGASGFLRLTGCKVDCGKSCLWTAVTGARHG
jgi:anti-anti-sigma regulatory factor